MAGWVARDAIVALGIGLLAALAVLPFWGPPTEWEPDGLFYEAQKIEVQGEPRQAALREVFASERAQPLREREAGIPPPRRRIGNAEWVEYSSQFYRRRWAVPVAAAAVDPVFGVDSLEIVALLGFVAAMALVYLLLRLRFSASISAALAVACMLMPPIREIASDPGTDTWGLALLLAGLISAILALERDRRWLAPWVAAVLLLSFTRDLTVVLVLAAAWVALRQRSRRAVALAASGAIAALPAPLLAGAPARENFAYVIDDYRVPVDASWGYVADHYPAQLWSVIDGNLTYPLDSVFPLAMFAVLALSVAGWVALFAIRPRGDAYFALMRAALVGGALTIAISANYTGWRLELAMLPPTVVGIALLAARVSDRLGELRARPSSPPATARSG